VRAEVAAEEFCALGDGEGASLLDVAGWVKAAERVNPNWDSVLDEIEARCPRWRDQVASRADDF